MIDIDKRFPEGPHSTFGPTGASIRRNRCWAVGPMPGKRGSVTGGTQMGEFEALVAVIYSSKPDSANWISKRKPLSNRCRMNTIGLRKSGIWLLSLETRL